MAYTPQTWNNNDPATPLSAARLGVIETGIQTANTTVLTPVPVKTTAYNAVAGDYIPVDTTSGAVTVTLPTAPSALARVGVKMVIQGGTNTVSVVCGGADVFNKVGGGTTLTLTLLNQAAVLQYSTGIWYVISDDLALSQLDNRYGNVFGSTTYSSTVTIDALVTPITRITATNGTAFTIAPTTNAASGRTLIISILNSSGGSMGVITWDATFKLAGAFSNPANTKQRTISFFYDGTNWIEISRAAADI